MAPHLLDRLVILLVTIVAVLILYWVAGCTVISVEGDGNTVHTNTSIDADAELDNEENYDAKRPEDQDDELRAAH